MKTLKETLTESVSAILDTASFKEPGGITSGYCKLDNILRGFPSGTLTILSSRPSLGKTALALNIIRNHFRNSQQKKILFASAQDTTDLTRRLLTIISGVPCVDFSDFSAANIQQLIDSVTQIKNYPLAFCDCGGDLENFIAHFKRLHAKKRFDLLIADDITPGQCRELKALARRVNIAVIALVSCHSPKDDLLCRGSADALLTLHRDRKAEPDADLGSPVEVIISKNSHGLCGSSRLYFIPRTMLFMESSISPKPFIAIPEVFEPFSPYRELRKYLAPEKLPLAEHLKAEIPQEDDPMNLSDILSLSACLEAVGDHENAVKVFLLGRKNCCTYERNAEVIYDWMFAAMYYWLFRDMENADRCLAAAGNMLEQNPDAAAEYQELERRMAQCDPVPWITDREIG